MSRRTQRHALDAIKRAQVVAVISVGCSRARAAQFVGCSASTIGRTAKRDSKFAVELRKAMCNAELALVKNIRSAAAKEQYWRAAAWALERGFPAKYARRDPDVLTIADVAALLVRFSKLVTEEVPASIRTRLLKKVDAMAESLGYKIKRARKEPTDAPKRKTSS